MSFVKFQHLIVVMFEYETSIFGQDPKFFTESWYCFIYLTLWSIFNIHKRRQSSVMVAVYPLPLATILSQPTPNTYTLGPPGSW